jgi:hypothetical protein
VNDRETVAGQRSIGEDVEERVRVRGQTAQPRSLVDLGVPRGLAVVVVRRVLGVLVRRGLLAPVAAARIGSGRRLLGVAAA